MNGNQRFIIALLEGLFVGIFSAGIVNFIFGRWNLSGVPTIIFATAFFTLVFYNGHNDS